jgi:hypothetical protein
LAPPALVARALAEAQEASAAVVAQPSAVAGPAWAVAQPSVAEAAPDGPRVAAVARASRSAVQPLAAAEVAAAASPRAEPPASGQPWALSAAPPA